jgi:hypothetical protein
MIVSLVASASPRVDRRLFSLPRGARLRKLGSPSATTRFARATPSHSIHRPAQVVLGCVENVLVSRNPLVLVTPRTSSRVSFALDMDLKIPTSRRAEACQQRGSRPDLSNGCQQYVFIRLARRTLDPCIDKDGGFDEIRKPGLARRN